MDIPLTPIVPAGEPMDGGVGTSVLGTSSGGRVGEPLPRVGEAPLPPMGFAQVKDFNQAQVVEWLDSIGYFKLFSSGLELATSKEDFFGYGPRRGGTVGKRPRYRYVTSEVVPWQSQQA